MLIRYKKAFEKIAMGLLSFMPNEKDIKKLTETIQSYEMEDNWILYLWKKNDEYIGTVGLVVDNGSAIIQHVSVVPSYRGEGVAKEMLQEVAELGHYQNVRATDETSEFVQKCIHCTEEYETRKKQTMFNVCFFFVCFLVAQQEYVSDHVAYVYEEDIRYC